MARYGSRGYAMKMASMRAQYRNKPQRRAAVRALTKVRRTGRTFK